MKSHFLPYLGFRLLAFWVGMTFFAHIPTAVAASSGYIEGEDNGHTCVLWTTKGHRMAGMGNYAAALECFKRGEAEFAEDHDTIDRRFISGFLTPQAEVLRLMGRSDEALAIAYRIFVIRDSLSNRANGEGQSHADVVGDNPHSHFSHRTAVFLVTSTVLMGVIVGGLWRYNHHIRKKNKALASTVERLRKKKGYKKAVKEAGVTPRQPSARENEDADERLFARLTTKIVEDKMYLKPNLSREDVIGEVYVPKNKFATLFQQYAGVSFPCYLNNLRVEEAKLRISEHPEYTFESIASECGIGSLQSFNRVFREHTGITPSEYRRKRCKS